MPVGLKIKPDIQVCAGSDENGIDSILLHDFLRMFKPDDIDKVAKHALLFEDIGPGIDESALFRHRPFEIASPVVFIE